MTRIRFRFKRPRFQATLVIVLSILVGVSTYSYLLSYQSRIESESALTPVYVAKQEIASGTSFEEISSQALLELRELPVKAIPAGVLTPKSNLHRNLKTRGPLASGQILTADYFVAEATPDVGLKIPKGMLAVTISLDDVARVGNFVSPGSRVVVFATTTSSSGTAQTKVLLSDALVLGIGSQTTQSVNGSIPTPSPLVTVALTPSDAQKLVLGSKTSDLTFALAYENDPIALVGIRENSSTRLETGN